MLKWWKTNVSKVWYGKLPKLETDATPVYDDFTCKSSLESSVDECFHNSRDAGSQDEETTLKKYLHGETYPEPGPSSMNAMEYGVNYDTFTPISVKSRLVDKKESKSNLKCYADTRTKGKLLKHKSYVEKETTPKRVEDDTKWDNSFTSDDPDDDVFLLKKNEISTSTTSGYVSQINDVSETDDDVSETDDDVSETDDEISQTDDDEPELDPFTRRNTGTRQSKLFHWNSDIQKSVLLEKHVLQMEDPDQQQCQRRSYIGINNHQSRENSPKRPIPTHVDIGNASNTIINIGDGQSTLYALGSKESSRVTKKVEAQTRSALRNAKTSGKFIKTEGYYAARYVVSSKSLVIVFGSGDGATTIVNQLLLEQTDDATPYVITDQSDWETVDFEKPAVVAIHDVQDKLLDNTLSRMEHLFLSGIDVKCILSINKVTNDTFPTHLQKYKENLVNLQSKHLITRQSMQLLATKILEEKNINVRHGMLAKGIGITADDVKEIVRTADRRGFARKMIHFVENDIREGPEIFKTPDLNTVEKIKRFQEVDHAAYYAILALHDYGGELSLDHVEKIRRLVSSKQTKNPMFQMIPHESLLFEHAGNMKNPTRLADILLIGLQILVHDLLEETNNIYRYRSSQVKTSVQIVLAKSFPKKLLLSCEFSFIDKRVSPRSAIKDTPEDLFVAVESNNTCPVKKAMIKRFTEEILEGNLSICTNHSVFQESWFVEDLFEYWKKNKHTTRNKHIKWKNLLWKILQQREKGLYPYSLIYFGQTQLFRLESSDGTTNAADKILKLAKWKYKRQMKSKWSEWVKKQEEVAIRYAIELNRVNTVCLLLDSWTDVTEQLQREQLLRVAIQLGRTDIVKLFVQKAILTNTIWWNTWLYAYDVLQTGENSDICIDVLNQLTHKAPTHLLEGKRLSLLQYAVSINDTALTRILCYISESNSKVNVNEKTETGQTALQIAVRNGNEKIAEILISRGARQIIQGNVEKLPIHEAAEMGNELLLKILLSNEPASINMKDPQGNTPLHFASMCGHTSVVAMLLSTDDIEINLTNCKKQTALHLASQNGHKDVMELLIVNGINVTTRDKMNETALTLAGMHHHYSCIELLIKEYEKEHARLDSELLKRAVNESNLDLFKLLIRNGYSFNVEENTASSPLLIAIESDNCSVVKFLIENGTNIHQMIDGRQLILWAASKSGVEMFRLLIKYNADFAAKDETTLNTVVHYAVEANKEDLTREILSMPESSALLDLKNRNGDTALHLLCRDGDNSSLLDLLLEKGFSTKMLNKQSEIPRRILERRLDTASKMFKTTEWRACTRLMKCFK